MNFSNNGSPTNNVNVVSRNSLLKSEIDEKQKLEKENFDLKMRVYYLEENMRQIAGGSSSSNIDAEELRIENANLRIQLDEKNSELEQRNSILIKAKGAIEALKSELDRMQLELQNRAVRELDLVRRLEAQSNDNNSLDYDHKSQLEQFDKQITSLRHLVSLKEQERLKSDNELSELRIELDATKSILSQLETERNRMESLCRTYEKNLNSANEEIIQNRAASDMWRIQSNEHQNSTDHLKDIIKGLQESNTKYISDIETKEASHREKIIELTTYYEGQIQDMRNVYRDESDRLKLSHSQMLRDVRENYTLELEKAKAHLDETLRSVKGTEAGEVYRVKEDMLERLHEKSDEISALKNQIQLDRSRMDALQRELESYKSDSRIHLSTIEELKRELSSKQESLFHASATIDGLNAEYKKMHEQIIDAKEQVARESSQCAQYQSKVDYLTEGINGYKQENKEYEKSILTLETECKRLKEELTMYQQKSDVVMAVTRENEQLRGVIANLKNDVERLNETINSQLNENQTLSEHESMKERRLSEALSSISEMKEYLNEQKAMYENQEKRLREECSRADHSEAALNEQRHMSESLKVQLNHEREVKLQAERRAVEIENQFVENKINLEKSAILMIRALIQWDQILEDTLQPPQEMENENLFNFQSPRSLKPLTKSFQKNIILNRHGLGISNNPLEMESSIDHALETLRNKSDELLQTSIVSVERVQIKIEQIQKIRDVFENRSKLYMKTVQSKMDVAQDKSSILSHKLVDLQTRLDNTRLELDRDKRQRYQSTSELKDFQDRILGEHLRKLSEMDQKYSSTIAALESQKQMNVSLEEKLSDLVNRNEVLMTENTQYRNFENEMKHITERFNSLAESNKLISYELDDRGDKLEESKRVIEKLQSDKSSLIGGVEKLKSQIEVRDKLLKDQELQMSTMKADIDKLKARQINPELQKTMKETQLILQSSISRSDDVDNPPGLSMSLLGGASTKSVMDFEMDKIYSELADICKVAERLVIASSDALERFEALQSESSSFDFGPAGGLKSHQKSDSISIEQDLFDLLESNSRLSVKLQQLSSEFKRSLRRSVDTSNTKRSSTNETATRTLEMERKFQNNENSYNISTKHDTSSIENVDSRQNFLKLDTSPSSFLSHLKQADRSHSTFNQTQYSIGAHGGGDPLMQSHLLHSTRDSSLSRGIEHNGISHLTSDISRHQRENVRFTDSSPFRESIGPRDNSFLTANTPINKVDKENSFYGENVHSDANYKNSSARDKNYTLLSHNHLTNATSIQSNYKRDPISTTSTSIPMTPFTSNIARDSADRLGKLGNDLQNLAAKLDNYSLRSSNHFNTTK